MKTALVLGAGGFIGNAMVKRLKSEGYWVRGVDLKYPEFSKSDADEFLRWDLRSTDDVHAVMRLDYVDNVNFSSPYPFNYLRPAFTVQKQFDEVYQFACLMGGAGFIFTKCNDADIMTSAMINLNVTLSAKELGVGKIFYASSACMYPQEIQTDPNNTGLKESDAYPLNPDSDYGLEKAFSERLYLAYARNYGLDVRIARFHNIYGPEGTYKGGKEKAPAAICRKVVEINERDYSSFDEPGPEIEIWGDGKQTRSFLYIDDCIDAVRLLMNSDFKEPINIGSEEMISINELANMVIDISGNAIEIKNIEGPVGVRGRNSNNDLIREVLGWEPKYTLKEGMSKLYNWIKSQYDGK